jgi:hypothetical protein
MSTILEDAKRTADGSLRKWREKFHPEEYPYMVYVNMFNLLFSIEGSWAQISSSFSQNSMFKDFQPAYVHLFKIVRNFQSDLSNERLNDFLIEDRVAGGYRSSFFAEDMELACEGNNVAVTDIEYGYWMISVICTGTIAWGAYGLLGKNMSEAFYEVFGGLFHEMKFETFEQLVSNYRRVIGAKYEFVKDIKNNKIPVEKVISGEVSDYYIIDFPILESLWPDKTEI